MKRGVSLPGDDVWIIREISARASRLRDLGLGFMVVSRGPFILGFREFSFNARDQDFVVKHLAACHQLWPSCG